MDIKSQLKHICLNLPYVATVPRGASALSDNTTVWEMSRTCTARQLFCI